MNKKDLLKDFKRLPTCIMCGRDKATVYATMKGKFRDLEEDYGDKANAIEQMICYSCYMVIRIAVMPREISLQKRDAMMMKSITQLTKTVNVLGSQLARLLAYTTAALGGTVPADMIEDQKRWKDLSKMGMIS